jgi:hypothetical protein
VFLTCKSVSIDDVIAFLPEQNVLPQQARVTAFVKVPLEFEVCKVLFGQEDFLLFFFLAIFFAADCAGYHLVRPLNQCDNTKSLRFPARQSTHKRKSKSGPWWVGRRERERERERLEEEKKEGHERTPFGISPMLSSRTTTSMPVVEPLSLFLHLLSLHPSLILLRSLPPSLRQVVEEEDFSFFAFKFCR